jgi:hypothetical protein
MGGGKKVPNRYFEIRIHDTRPTKHKIRALSNLGIAAS